MMETPTIMMVAPLHEVLKLDGAALLEASPLPAHALKCVETELFMTRPTASEMMGIR